MCALAGVGLASAAEKVNPAVGLELDVQPRVCTLAEDETCSTTVRAQWRSPRRESLCLVIVGRPHVRQCWDAHSQGRYELELTFSTDLIVELRDPELREVLASEAITVIREALRLRRKRRQPWDIFF